MIENFEKYLKSTNLSENTMASYLFALKQFNQQYDKITKKNLRDYKVWLIESYKPKTVNLRLRAINCYLESIGKAEWKMPFVKVQQKAFLENVISEADYKYFKTRLKKDDEMFWYFVIRFLAATGARVSELIQIKVEHVKIGYIDLYSKGGKLRRIYIPKASQKEALNWLEECNRESGFLFLNGIRIPVKIEKPLKINVVKAWPPFPLTYLFAVVSILIKFALIYGGCLLVRRDGINHKFY